MKPTPPPNGHTTRDQLREARANQRAIDKANGSLHRQGDHASPDVIARQALNVANGVALVLVFTFVIAVVALILSIVALAK